MGQTTQPQRIENGFLKEFCAFLSETEVPSVFALWSAITAVAAVLGRDAFIDLGLFKIYPNLYTVLVGPAACKKSTAISGIGRLLNQIDTPVNMLSQKMTPEALIQGLAEAPLRTEDSMITEKAEGLAVVSELSTLIDKNSFQNGMIALLTDLWDAPNVFEYRTRSRGKETLNNCCLSILSGSTIQWVKEAIPVVAIGGGFTSRVLFIYQERSEKLVAIPSMSEENKAREVKLVEELNHISKLGGEYKMTPQARVFYTKDYETFNRSSEMFEDKNLAGYAGRRHTVMLKLGLIISASTRDTRLIHEGDLKIAQKLLLSLERFLPRVMQAITSEAVGDVCEEVIIFLQRKKFVKKSQLMGKFMSKLSKRELDVVLETLADSKLIMFEKDVIIYKGK